MFFTDEMVNLIVEQTNLYRVQNQAPINCTMEDVLKFLKIELIMGFAKFPAYTDYWSTTWGYSPINKIMPLKKYQKLRGNLHFANNLEDPKNDGFYKIRAFSEIFLKNCVKVPNERRQSFDETILAYKVAKAGCKKQYNPKKTTKWGLKMYTRAGTNGFVYDFLYFDGARTFIGREFSINETNSLGSSGLVVVALAKTINIDKPVVCFDNYFTSFRLLKILQEDYNYFALGTIQRNRIQKININFTKANVRGDSIELVDEDNHLYLVNWLDSREVLICSNYVGLEPMQTTKRFDRIFKKSIDLPCPQAEKDYNRSKGGVDLANQFVAQNKTDIRSHI